MKKIMLFLYFLIVFTSSLFSFSKTEPTTFIQEKMSENHDFTLVHTISIGENKFLVLGKDDNYLQAFYSDGTTFMYPIYAYFLDYSDDYSYRESINNFYYRDDINLIEQLIDKKCDELYFYVVDLNFDEVSDFITYEEGGMCNIIYFSSFEPDFEDSIIDFIFYTELAFFEHIYIEFCIIDGKRGFLFTNCEGNYFTVGGGPGYHEENEYFPDKKYTQFYEYNPKTQKYELNEYVGKEEITRAIKPHDYFAYDGLKFSKLDSKLTDENLKNLNKAQLRLMRNAVFARHGRAFNSVDLQSLWNCYPWYKKNPNYSDDLLTEIDKYNIELIKKYEASLN